MITAEEVRELLDYDPETGVFTWRERPGASAWNTRWSGKIAGSRDSYGYVQIGIHNVRYLAHRLAWLYVYGVWPTGELDHKDRSRRANAIGNLREVSRALNVQNASRARQGNTSGLLGVCWFKQTGSWRAQIYANGRKIHLGLFECKHEAHAAYLKAKAKFHSGYIPERERAA